MSAQTPLSLSDWFSGSDPISMLLWTAYVFVVVSSALVGGFATGLVFQHVVGIFIRNLSIQAVSRARIIGGVVSAILAVLLLNPGWLGLGGGGASGPDQPGSAEVEPDQRPKDSADASVPSAPPSLAERPAADGVLRILVLGSETKPPYQPVNRFFAFLDDSDPQPLDAEQVMQRIEALRKNQNLKEVELVVVPQSTSIHNAPVQKLRSKLSEANLRVYLPPDLP
jgi:hypothetical protein